jgi:hypothetical protein
MLHNDGTSGAGNLPELATLAGASVRSGSPGLPTAVPAGQVALIRMQHQLEPERPRSAGTCWSVVPSVNLVLTKRMPV